MTLQEIAVALIVPLCALYAAWRLTGAAARRRIAAWLARRSMPAAWRQRLLKADSDASDCGCDGCARPEGARPEPATHSIVRLHRRSR